MAKLLVADDNALSVHFFSEAVAIAGHDAATSEDGRAALALASTQAFDLILLDARMPGLDGAQVLQAIRCAEGPNRATPAILTTAEGAVDRETWLSAGFVDVIYKPIGIPALHALVSRHLNGLVTDENLLNDALAAEKTGGNATIIAALRGLFGSELASLPSEIEDFAAASNMTGLLDRLHRLDASAGFCGAPALTEAIKKVRTDIDATSMWPEISMIRLLAVCARTRAALP